MTAGKGGKIPEAAIEVTGLTKRYGAVEALKGIDLWVPEGSVYGFLGPNGAGKTTTIKILLGLTPPTGGTVKLLGRVMDGSRTVDILEHIGYLPQDPVFPDRLTAGEIMEFTAQVYGMDPADAKARIDELLTEFHLKDARKRMVNAFSRGMKQRLGLAVALLPRPSLLILDEPASALDPEGRREVLDLVKNLKSKATVFFSSHILDDVERVADRVAIIDSGTVLAESDIQELMGTYAPYQFQLGIRPGQLERAESLLKAQPWALGVSRDGDRLVITTRPDQVAAVEENAIPLLVAAGVTITEFVRRKADLEDVFFNILNRARASQPDVHEKAK